LDTPSYANERKKKANALLLYVKSDVGSNEGYGTYKSVKLRSFASSWFSFSFM